MPETNVQERHASWAELFFDLVVVAGVGSLAHVLATDLELRALGVYAVLFLAFWLSWTSFMLYGNVARADAHVLRLMAGMFGLGVMAAAVPGVAHVLLAEGEAAHHLSSRPLGVFAVAYFVTRAIGSKSWGRGEVLLDVPAAQHLVGAVPWLVSAFVHDDDVRLGLWAVGVAIDLVLILAVSGDRVLAGALERIRELNRRSPDRPRQRDRDGRELVVAGVSVDPAHLAERLGLFVIIVLGEGVVQVVQVASEAEPDRGLLAAGLVSFVLLAGMFGLSVVYGYAGVPHLREGAVAVRPGLVLHVLVTGVLAAVAVALATVVEDGHEPLDDAHRWLLCGAVIAYFAIGLAASLVTRGFRTVPVAVWVLTGIGAPLLLGFVGADLRGTVLAAYVALVVIGHVVAEYRAAQSAHKRPTDDTHG